MGSPPRRLLTSDGSLMLGGTTAPLIMGIVNATPDSFSDAGRNQTLDERVALAAAQLADGAGLIDIGGESGTTDRPPDLPPTIRLTTPAETSKRSRGQ